MSKASERAAKVAAKAKQKYVAAEVVTDGLLMRLASSKWTLLAVIVVTIVIGYLAVT